MQMTTTKKKKILVTGGLGNIGHHVVKKLQAMKHEVQVIDALTTYGITPADELEDLINQRLLQINKKTPIYKEDICTPAVDQVFDLFKPDVVVHLAGFPGPYYVEKNPIEASRTMCVGVANVLDCCTRHKTDRFVYISSDSVYGDFDHALEDDKLDPNGQFSIWKIAGEELVKNYTNETGQSHVILRPSVVYGEREQSDRMIGDYFKRAIANTTLYVKGKDQMLDFTYVKDLADGIALASTTENVAGIYNISRGKKEKIVDVANLIVKLVGKGKVKTIDKKKNFINCGTLDCSKAEDEFKFKPKTNIEKGLDLYYNWLKKTKRTWPE